MDDYLAKPIHAAELYEIIQHIAAPQTAVPAACHEPIEAADPVPWPEALVAAGGDRELLAELVTAAREDIRQQLSAVRQAIERGDAASLRLAAHTIKGSTRYFGETDVYRHALQLETLARDGQLAATAETIGELEAAAAKFSHELQMYLDRSGDSNQTS
jgi:HPt (histidine-containing phosphotransfer) domain-containing protein